MLVPVNFITMVTDILNFLNPLCPTNIKKHYIALLEEAVLKFNFRIECFEILGSTKKDKKLSPNFLYN